MGVKIQMFEVGAYRSDARASETDDRHSWLWI